MSPNQTMDAISESMLRATYYGNMRIATAISRRTTYTCIQLGIPCCNHERNCFISINFRRKNSKFTGNLLKLKSLGSVVVWVMFGIMNAKQLMYFPSANWRQTGITIQCTIVLREEIMLVRFCEILYPVSVHL